MIEKIETFPVHPFNQQFRFVRVYSASEHVVLVVLDRPQKRNAIHATMWKEIGSVFARLGTGVDDSSCRAIVLAGKGSSFCSGIDFTDTAFLPNTTNTTSSTAASSSQGDYTDTTTTTDVARVGISFLPKLRYMQECFTALEKCPVPVIAAIHGSCIGAGMDLISAADVRVCTADAQFSLREVVMGLAADVGTLQRLPKIVGNQSMVRELCYTGRNMGASEALQMGLVSHVIAEDVGHLLSTALEIATTIARHSPVAVQGTKQSLIYSRDHSVQDGLEHIAMHNALCLQGDDTSIAWTAGTRTSRTTPVVYPDMAPHSRL